MVICLFNFIRNSWTALQIRTIFSFHQQNLKVLGIPHPICRTDYRLPGRHASGRIISARCQCVDPWDVCVCVCVCTRTRTCMHAQSLSCVWRFATAWMVVFQAPPSIRFCRQEYWSGLPFPSLDLPDPGIEPMSSASPALAGRFFTTAPPGKPPSKGSKILLFENHSSFHAFK